MTEEELHQKAKKLLDENVDQLDGPTLSKLHQARSQALKRRVRILPGYTGWLGTGALTASFAVALVYFDQSPPPLPAIYEDPLQQAAAEDMELMDDLEFMAWLVLEEGDNDNAVNST